MPSPIGHALAGAAVAWLSDLSGRRPVTRLALACAVLAAAPDLDLLLPAIAHRTWTHSITAALVAGLIMAFVEARSGFLSGCGKESRNRFRRVLRVGGVCAAAWGTHVLLDWLGRDTATPTGLMVLWPLRSRYYHSGLDWFLEISRRYWRPEEFVWGNLRSLAAELLRIGPVVLAIWTVRRLRSGRPVA